jgi:hypothetical protein
MSQAQQQAYIAGLFQLLESLIITALIAGIVAASSTLSDNGKIDWQVTGGAFAIAFLFSLAHGLATYLKMLPPPTVDSTTQVLPLQGLGVTQAPMAQNSAQKGVEPRAILLGAMEQEETVKRPAVDGGVVESGKAEQ